MEDITDNKRVAAYLNKAMNKEEALAFEMDLKKDATLYEAYQEALSMDKLLKMMAYETLKDKIKTIATTEKPVVKETTPIRFSPSNLAKVGAIAASLLLLLSIGAFWYANAHFSNQQLAQQYIELPAANNLRGTLSSDLSSIFVQLQAQDYPSAIQRLTTISAEQPTYETAQYLLGLSYLKIGDSKAAATAFQVIVDQPKNQPFYEEAYWHLVVVSLQQGDLQQVEQGIATILKDASFSNATKRKASALQEAISSTWRSLVYLGL